MQGFTVFWTDRAGNVLEPVAGREETMSIQSNADGQYHHGSEMTVHELPAWVNPYQHRIQVLRDNTPVGFFMFDSENPKVSRSKRSTTITLVDPLKIIGISRLTAPFGLPAGTNVAEAVAQIVRDRGETRIAVTPSDATLQAPLVWMPGETTWLNVANDLLAAVNFWGLHTDAEGRFTIAPYQLPEDRPVVHEFVAGDGSKMVGEYETSREYLSVPNRFIAVSQGYDTEDSEAPPLIGVAENVNPESPFSTVRRGFFVDAYDTVEATSQSEIDGIAARRLSQITGGGDYVQVQHLWIPSLALNDLVHVATAAGDVFDATVNEMSIPEHGLVSAQWRKVEALT